MAIAALVIADQRLVARQAEHGASVRLSLDAPPRSRLTRCILHGGDIFYLKSPPKKDALPTILLHSPPF